MNHLHRSASKAFALQRGTGNRFSSKEQIFAARSVWFTSPRGKLGQKKSFCLLCLLPWKGGRWPCCAAHREGLLGCGDCCGVAPRGKGENADIRTVLGGRGFRKLSEVTCQNWQKAEKLIAVHQTAHHCGIRSCFPRFPCCCSSVAQLQQGQYLRPWSWGHPAVLRWRLQKTVLLK